MAALSGETVRTPAIWPVDVCHAAAHAGSLVLLALFADQAPHAGLWAIWNVAVLGMLGVLAALGPRLDLKRAAVWRMAFAAALIPIYFTQLGALVPYVNPRPWERTLHDWDLALTGGHEPLHAIGTLAHPLLTEILQWIYDFYYFIPVILGAAVLKAGRPLVVARMTFAIALCIYLSYAGYYAVPATGPNIDHHQLYGFGPLPGVFLATELRETLFAIEKIKQNCFPSGHTAVSLLSLALAFLYARRSLPLLVPLVLALVFSTLYLRYHYLVDVLAGTLLAALSFWLALATHRIFEGRRRLHGDPHRTSG